MRLKAALGVFLAICLLGGCSTLSQDAATGDGSAPSAPSAGPATGEAPPEPEPIEAGIAPPPGEYAPGFDALHYDVHLQMSKAGSMIKGRTQASFERTATSSDTLYLDLTGLAVAEVRIDGDPAGFQHDEGRLRLPLSDAVGDQFDVTVAYVGEPDDGLIIGRNVHGEPTVFADNWPNRARFWFPSIDHPSDKASVRFTVQLEEDDERKVVSNGTAVTFGDYGEWIWETDVTIPTYTMVVGVADFAIDTVGTSCSGGRCIDVTAWLFAPDRGRGAPSFARASEMVDFYSELVAPFPYEKLAHVQSSTRFGGMENVTAIFYSEQAIAEGRDIETTVAHETAHQWFGNAVTEADWHHLWLSEGFATYFGALFFEYADGEERFREIMESSRNGFLQSDAAQFPIVHEEETNLFRLLNANNYNKGAWVLHMLRRQLGDQAFFAGIRAYYERHEHGTALTDDLRWPLEEASGRNLESFFQQWVFEPGYPQLRVDWEADGEAMRVTVRQVQEEDWPTFSFPLVIELVSEEDTVRTTIDVDERIETLRIPVSNPPTTIVVDPEGDLLKEIVAVGE